MSHARPSVLILTQFHSIGGLERSVLALCQEWKRSGSLDPIWMTYDGISGVQTLEPEIRTSEIRFEPFIKRSGFSWRALRRMWRCVSENRIGLVHTHDLGPLVYATFLKGMSGGRLRLVHTQHGFAGLGSRRRNLVYEAFFPMAADELCVVSSDIRSRYRELYVRPDRIHVVPNGVCFPERGVQTRAEALSARRQLLASLAPVDSQGSPQGFLRAHFHSLWLLCLGRIHPGKGQDHVLELWKGFSRELRRRACLLFVGPETSPGELQRLESLNTVDPTRVCFAGSTADPDAWIRASELFLSGSEYEGLPLASIEAAGSGIPMALSEISGHRMFGDPGRGNALLFRLDRLGEEAARLERYIVDQCQEENVAFTRSRRERWLATDCIRSELSVRAMADAYQRIYSIKHSGEMAGCKAGGSGASHA